MKILDKNNIEIMNPDLSLGYFMQDKIFIKHHEEIPAVIEQWHYETIKTYPNGGKDLKRVIDVPGSEAKEAYDEYEDIQRYVLYTKEELDEMNKTEQEKTDIKSIKKDLEILKEEVANWNIILYGENK